MTQPAKARRHFIAWSPQFVTAFRAPSKAGARSFVQGWSAPIDGREPTWEELQRTEGWRVTEVSE